MVLAFALCAYFIVEGNYSKLPSNSLQSGQTVRIRSTIVPELLNNNVNLTIPQQELSDTYKLGQLPYFVGDDRQTIVLTASYQVPGDVDCEDGDTYNLGETVTVGYGNRMVMQTTVASVGSIPTIKYDLNDPFVYYTLYDGRCQYLGDDNLRLFAPFMYPMSSIGNVGNVDIGSAPIYEMIWSHHGGGTFTSNDIIGRLRFGPGQNTGSDTTYYNFPGIRSYYLFETNITDNASELDYLFYVDI